MLNLSPDDIVNLAITSRSIFIMQHVSNSADLTYTRAWLKYRPICIASATYIPH